MAKFPHAAALGSLGAFAIERGRSLRMTWVYIGADMWYFLSLFLVSSCFSFFSFQPHSNKQGNERYTSHRERARARERERDLPHCHLSIYLSIHHHHVQQGATTRIYRSGNLQLSPRALRTPRPSSHSRRMDSTCCRYVVSFRCIILCFQK